MSKDNNSAEKIEDIEEKINQEIAQRKNKELEKLLNDFSIETKKKDIFIEEGLSDDAISFSKNIEDYIKLPLKSSIFADGLFSLISNNGLEAASKS